MRHMPSLVISLSASYYSVVKVLNYGTVCGLRSLRDPELSIDIFRHQSKTFLFAQY